MVSVKVFLTLAVIHSWPLIHLDVNNAFLHGDLFEKVYMDLSLGYQPKVAAASQGARLVCKIHKSIYGLKQPSRQWFAKFSNALLQYDFLQSKSDYSLFTMGIGYSSIALLVYVDDIILTGSNSAAIASLKDFLYS